MSAMVTVVDIDLTYPAISFRSSPSEGYLSIGREQLVTLRITLAEHERKVCIASWKWDFNGKDKSMNLSGLIHKAKTRHFKYMLLDFVSIDKSSEDLVQNVLSYSEYYRTISVVTSYSASWDFQRAWIQYEYRMYLENPINDLRLLAGRDESRVRIGRIGQVLRDGMGLDISNRVLNIKLKTGRSCFERLSPRDKTHVLLYLIVRYEQKGISEAAFESNVLLSFKHEMFEAIDYVPLDVLEGVTVEKIIDTLVRMGVDTTRTPPKHLSYDESGSRFPIDQALIHELHSGVLGLDAILIKLSAKGCEDTCLAKLILDMYTQYRNAARSRNEHDDAKTCYRVSFPVSDIKRSILFGVLSYAKYSYSMMHNILRRDFSKMTVYTYMSSGRFAELGESIIISSGSLIDDIPYMSDGGFSAECEFRGDVLKLLRDLCDSVDRLMSGNLVLTSHESFMLKRVKRAKEFSFLPPLYERARARG
jgi:hypothetical protein